MPCTRCYKICPECKVEDDRIANIAYKRSVLGRGDYIISNYVIEMNDPPTVIQVMKSLNIGATAYAFRWNHGYGHCPARCALET